MGWMKVDATDDELRMSHGSADCVDKQESKFFVNETGKRLKIVQLLSMLGTQLIVRCLETLLMGLKSELCCKASSIRQVSTKMFALLLWY